MEQKIKIRPFDPTTEKEQLIQLWVDCGLVVAHNNPEQDIQRKLDDNPNWLLVAEILNPDISNTDRTTIIGSCMVGYDGHRGWIYYLAVSPSHQRLGIASKMMDHAEHLLREVGCPKINLMIRETNLKVIDFYNSIGYAKDPVITMSKRLKDDEPHDFGRVQTK